MQILYKTNNDMWMCHMCNTAFAEVFVKSDMFQDFHRNTHTKMNLDTPDLPENDETQAWLDANFIRKEQLF